MRAWIALVGGALVASCGERVCAPVDVPVPMDAARAAALMPDVQTGVAVSTTLIYGDCRAIDEADPNTCEGGGNPACVRRRAEMRVFVLPTNVSVPSSPRCAPGFPTDGVAALASAEVVSSPAGEAVAAVPPGRYRVVLAEPDAACATCGLVDAPETCLVDVPRTGFGVRDLVLDRASH